MRTLLRPQLRHTGFEADLFRRHRYYSAGGQTFHWTIEKLTDDCYYAWVQINQSYGKILKLKGFKKRKLAKLQAWNWYRKRKAALEHVREAAEKRRKPEPTKADTLRVKIAGIEKRIKKIDSKIKRLETHRRKANRSLKYYRGQLEMQRA